MLVVKRFLYVLALLSVHSASYAQPSQVAGLTDVHRARSERLEPARETDSNAVEIRASDEENEYQVYALTDVQLEHHVDVHRNVLGRERHANRYRLCTTPCRLVIDRPLLLSVEGIDVPVAPEAQRQRWRVIPERSGLRIGARAFAVLGFLGALASLILNRVVAAPAGVVDAGFRGSIAGAILGMSFFIAGTTAARLFRGRTRRVY